MCIAEFSPLWAIALARAISHRCGSHAILDCVFVISVPVGLEHISGYHEMAHYSVNKLATMIGLWSWLIQQMKVDNRGHATVDPTFDGTSRQGPKGWDPEGPQLSRWPFWLTKFDQSGPRNLSKIEPSRTSELSESRKISEKA